MTVYSSSAETTGAVRRSVGRTESRPAAWVGPFAGFSCVMDLWECLMRRSPEGKPLPVGGQGRSGLAQTLGSSELEAERGTKLKHHAVGMYVLIQLLGDGDQHSFVGDPLPR